MVCVQWWRMKKKKKKDTRTLERFDKSEDWLAVYWGG